MSANFLTVIQAIISKDLRAELRSRELVTTMLLFALLSVLAFSFALELDRLARTEAVSGVLWVTVIYASILGLNRSIAIERDNNSLDAVLLAPIDRGAIFIGKFLGNTIFTLLAGAVLLPLMTILYNTNLLDSWLWLTLILGTLAITIIGTLLATMTAQTRSREALLPIAMLPLILPVLLSAIKATNGITSNAPRADWLLWIQILIVVNIIYFVLCFFSFRYVIEE